MERLLNAEQVDTARQRCVELAPDVDARFAEQQFRAIKNGLIVNAPYISQPVGERLWEAINVFSRYSSDLIVSQGTSPRTMRQEHVDRERLEVLANEIRGMMRSEMGGGSEYSARPGSE